MSLNVTFIGGGNMAGALIGGLRRAQPAATVHVVEPAEARRAQLAAEFGASTHAAITAAALPGDTVLLAVKPQQLRAVCDGLQPHLGARLVISIAAGVRAADLSRWLGTERVVRAMPNTPALIGRGITGLAGLAGVTAADRERAALLLGAVGPVVWVADDAAIDAVTAVSGSGPAYLFRFIEALEAAALAVDLPPEVARQLALATVQGAAELAARSPLPPATLREQVTSKGGTTAAALAVMEARGLQAIVVDAVAAARAPGLVTHLAAARTGGREMGDEAGRTP